MCIESFVNTHKYGSPLAALGFTTAVFTILYISNVLRQDVGQLHVHMFHETNYRRYVPCLCGVHTQIVCAKKLV